MSRSSSSQWATYTLALALGGCIISGGVLYYSYSRRLKEIQLEDLNNVSEHACADDNAASTSARGTSAAQAKVSAKLNGYHPADKSVGGPDAADSNAACGFCHKSKCHLLRCSRCKQASYCSVECQRRAWPQHKQACKILRANASAAAASRNEVQPASNGHHPVLSSNSNGTANGTDSSAAPQSDTDLTQAVRQYLGQAVSSKTDILDNVFETAFFHFVRTEYRTAIEQFTEARDLAKQANRPDMQGECCKWLGHCYNKLANLPLATRSFLAGHELGKSIDKPKLIVDCLSGLGCMYRGQNETEKALKYLRQALEVANAAEDTDSTASVECNLGAALMRVDIPAAVDHLRRACELREMQVEHLHNKGETSSLATAIMEHASASMNLAGGLVALKQHAEAEAAFVQALKVFEMMEDVDKVVKVLINLANLTELELQHDPQSCLRALAYRSKLFEVVAAHQHREPSEVCSICLDELNVEKLSPADNPVIILACFHCLHNKCWQQWAHESCPTCKQPVTLV